MSAQPNSWPQVTDELLPNTLFQIASLHPDVIYAEYFSDPTNLANGYRKVTYQDFASAVHALAWRIEENVGKPSVGDGSETMVYIGPNDLRYGFLVLASIISGYKMLFPSPRYGAEAIAGLIDSDIVDSNIMLQSSDPVPVVAEVLQKRSMHNYQIPSLETLLSSKPRTYPFTKTFLEHKHEPFLVLHTSGTTGFPKPILWTHDWANSVFESFHLPPTATGIPSSSYFCGPNQRVMFLFPAFHTSGISGYLLFPLCRRMTCVIPLPPAPTLSSVMDQIAEVLDWLGDDDGARAHLITLPPPHMEYMGSNPAMLDRISQRVKTVMFGGGGISVAEGNAVAAKMKLINDVGSTELGLWPSLERPESNIWNGDKVDELWRYTPLHPVLNIRLDPVDSTPEGDVCEAIMIRNVEGWVQPLFKINTKDKERSLGDLFIRHPRHPDLWRHYGRSDDVLNFLTGEKFIPVAAEQRISANTAVEEVIMVGTTRPKSALIIRLKDGASLEDAWKMIDEVNQTSPVYARVAKDMILVVNEPFLQTAKGSIQKKAMLELYQKQLDDMYKTTAISYIVWIGRNLKHFHSTVASSQPGTYRYSPAHYHC
jgi:acyl-coenzyme A synthetase/AMP-(fatty) acid ligase